MANNPYVNKVVLGDKVLIDTSEVTVDETSLEAGKTALNAAGALITGTRQFVSGVKGAEESEYRTGNVNLTPANIGAVNKSGDVMTGDLRIKIDCNTTQQDNGVTTAAVKRIAFVDNIGAYVGEISVSARPDGATVISLASANKHPSQGASTYESSITIIHSKDGTITYSLSDPAAFRTAISVKRVQTAVNSPTAIGTAVAFIDAISQDTQGVITATKKTVANASTSAAGLMSADDKTKLNGIANGATANTGTVTSIATGSGLTGGTITGSGTVKANLTSETNLTNAAADGTETAGRVYPVRLDKNGKLAVNVPWVDTNTQTITGVKGDKESSYRTGNVNLTPANIGAAYAINIASSVSEWSGIFQALDVLPTYTPGIIYSGSGSASKLTSGKLTSYINGIVTRMSENVFDFMVQSGANPAYMYSFRVTGLTSSAGTPGTVYRFTGTAI